jgi:hypothetical protein
MAGGGGAKGGSGGQSGGSDAAGNGASPCMRGMMRACCGSGVQTCSGDTEFGFWGPCMTSGGRTLSCCMPGEFGPGCDGGVAVDAGCLPGEFKPGCDGGTPPDVLPPGIEGCCSQGTTRWCDTNTPAWGKQYCGPNGRFGACMTVTTHPSACSGCSAMFYDPDCCVASNECCKGLTMHMISGTPQTGCNVRNVSNGDSSVGNCAGIACGF